MPRGILIVVLSLLLAAMPAGGALAGPKLVVDAASGEVLYEEQPFALWYPASLTKLMTAYLAFSAIRAGRFGLDSKFVYSQRARREPPSKIGLPVGAEMDMQTALKALVVKSANDVAVMLAEGISGSVENFVDQMNRTALRLGMTNTRYANPNGMPHPGQITNARDMAVLARTIIGEFPEYGYLFAMRDMTLGKRRLRSYNTLLKSYEGADGMKTGFICASGYNLVASATRDDRRLIAVVLGATSMKEREASAADLLNQAFTEPTDGQRGRALHDMEPSELASVVPTHMGPQVCKRKYPSTADPRQIDDYARRVAALFANPPTPTLRPRDGLDNVPIIASGAGEPELRQTLVAPVPETGLGTIEEGDAGGEPAMPLPEPRPVR